MEHFVEFEDVCKYYQTGSVKIAAADHLNFYAVSYTHLTLPTILRV